jgi:hypothetical protein
MELPLAWPFTHNKPLDFPSPACVRNVIEMPAQ